MKETREEGMEEREKYAVVEQYSHRFRIADMTGMEDRFYRRWHFTYFLNVDLIDHGPIRVNKYLQSPETQATMMIYKYTAESEGGPPPHT
jgi:hypothetical protein